MAKKIDSTLITRLAARLERRGFNHLKPAPTAADYAILYSSLSDIGYNVSASIGGSIGGPRAEPPDYKTLGFDKKAGAPSKDDIQRYRDITAGGELTEDGFVCPILLTDNDLIVDRYKVFSFRTMMDISAKYLGRSNDNNHSFDATEAAGRLIDIFVGNDPGVEMHADYPITALQTLDPGNPFEGKYTAICGYMAFPAESGTTIDKLKSGLIQDVSVAVKPTSTKCSSCLEDMASIFIFNYCETCGFPGDKDEQGASIVGILSGCGDVRTFGHVSDGAAKRARYVLDYTVGK